MAVSDSYLEFVLEQLAPLGDIAAKRMFGGVGLYSDEVFFAVIDNNTLYFKVDDSNRSDYLRAKAKPFQPNGNGSYSISYYEVPPAVIEDSRKLHQWFEKSVDAARKNRKSKKKKARA